MWSGPISGVVHVGAELHARHVAGEERRREAPRQDRRREDRFADERGDHLLLRRSSAGPAPSCSLFLTSRDAQPEVSTPSTKTPPARRSRSSARPAGRGHRRCRGSSSGRLLTDSGARAPIPAVIVVDYLTLLYHLTPARRKRQVARGATGDGRVERRTRIWIGLGTAVLVGGTDASTAPRWRDGPARRRRRPPRRAPARAAGHGRAERLFAAQADASRRGRPRRGRRPGPRHDHRVPPRRAPIRPPSPTTPRRRWPAYADLVHDAYVAAQARRARAAGRRSTRSLADALAGDASTPRARPGSTRAPAYLRTEAFQFYAGPVDGPGGPLPRLNAWPVDPAFIDGLVADPAVAARLPQPRPAQPGRGAGPGHDRLARDRVPALGRGRRPARRRRSSPARAATTGGATTSPRVAQLLVNDLGVARRRLGARTPTTIAPPSRRWTSATRSAAPSTA